MGSLLKWLIAGVGGYLGYKYITETAYNNIKDSISFAVAGGRIHKISLNSGIDLRLNLDFTNLTGRSLSLALIVS